MRVEGGVEMRAAAQDFFSTGDGRLAMSKAGGWVLTTVEDIGGQVVQNARIALSELLPHIRVLEACLKAIGEGANRPVEVFLGFTPEGDQLCAAVTEHGMGIMEVSADGVAHRLLCGPYPMEEARRMADAVAKASAG
jgi:hypothetical protein